MTGPMPEVGVKFRADGLDGVRRGLKLVKDEAEPTGRQWGMASRQIAGGLEQVARSGKVTGESLKSIISNGAEMAFMFGAGGPIVAALSIVGVAIYEGITNNIKEARAEARKFQEEIAGVRRSGNLATAGDVAQRLFSGDRFAVRQEDESEREFEARRIGVVGLRQRVASLGEYRKEDLVGPHGEVLKAQTGPSYEALQLIKEYSGYLKTYEERAKQAAAAVNELAEKEGKRLAVVAGLTLAERERLRPIDVNTRSPYQIGGPGGATRFVDEITQSQAERSKKLFLDPPPIKRRTNLLGDSKATTDMVETMKQIGEIAGQGFVDTLASTIEAGIGKVFEKGANIGGVFAAIGQAALGGIGQMISQIGRATLAASVIIQKIKDSFMTLSPAVGIAASIGLIALGATLSAAGGRMGANASGGGGGGGYGGYSSSSGYGSAIIDRGIIDPTRGAGVSGSRISGNTFNFIGPRDPNVVRQFEEIIAQIDNRGRA